MRALAGRQPLRGRLPESPRILPQTRPLSQSTPQGFLDGLSEVGDEAAEKESAPSKLGVILFTYIADCDVRRYHKGNGDENEVSHFLFLLRCCRLTLGSLGHPGECCCADSLAKNSLLGITIPLRSGFTLTPWELRSGLRNF